MPIAYLIDKTHNYVFTNACGRVTVDDILGHFEAARREQILAYKELIDARRVTPPFLSNNELWRAALSVRFSPAREPFGPRAVVVSNEELFGMTRLFTSFLHGYFPISGFRHQAAAEEWLACWLPAGQ
jgi:hypothetical protein